MYDQELVIFDHCLQVNVFGLTICSREAVQSMKAKGVDDGHIINLNRYNSDLSKKRVNICIPSKTGENGDDHHGM